METACWSIRRCAKASPGWLCCPCKRAAACLRDDFGHFLNHFPVFMHYRTVKIPKHCLTIRTIFFHTAQGISVKNEFRNRLLQKR